MIAELSDVKAEDGPVLLCLRRLNLEHLDFSEFSEFSISPSRDLLLFLSREEDRAFLLPVTDNELNKRLVKLSTCTACFSESDDDPKARHDDFGETPRRDLRRSTELFHVGSAVKSIAWGSPGDAHSSDGTSLYKQFLFVSYSQKIHVHGFRHLMESDDSVPSSILVGSLDKGKWVDWGNCSGTSSDVRNSNPVSRRRGFVSFLSDTETGNYEGKYAIKYPSTSSFPSSAAVVSFEINLSDPRFQEFVHTSEQPDCNTYTHTKVENRLRRIFSSPSHQLIGMVLDTVDSPFVNENECTGENLSCSFVVVAVVFDWGIECVSSVKLSLSNKNSRLKVGWVDFQFSGYFLLCLNTTGLITVWNAINGSLITEVDALRSSQVNLVTNSSLDPLLSDTNYDSTTYLDPTNKRKMNVGTAEERSCKLKSKDNVEVCSFRSLLVVSEPLMVGAVDLNGLVYVISLFECLQESYFTSKESAVQSRECSLDLLSKWNIAGSDIVHKAHYLRLLKSESLRYSCFTREDLAFRCAQEYPDMWGKENYSGELKIDQDKLLYQHSFQRNQEKYGIFPYWDSLTRVRRLFLPIYPISPEDVICFSAFGITRLIKCSSPPISSNCRIIHTSLCLPAVGLNDDDFEFRSGIPFRKAHTMRKELHIDDRAVSCCYQGFMYLVTPVGLSVVLPSVEVPQDFSLASLSFWRPSSDEGSEHFAESLLLHKALEEKQHYWQSVILNRALIYEGLKEAERVCAENGWDIKVARKRRLQFALNSLRSDEIEEALEMLVDVNHAEDGVLLLLFTAMHQAFHKFNKDNDFIIPLRLLTLAMRFASKVIHQYGLNSAATEENYISVVDSNVGLNLLPKDPVLHTKRSDASGKSSTLREMAHLLEMTRSLHYRLQGKLIPPGKAIVDAEHTSGLMSANLLPTDVLLTEAKTVSAVLVDTLNAPGELGPQADRMTHMTVDFTDYASLPLQSFSESQTESAYWLALSPQTPNSRNLRRQWVPPEIPRDMIYRWELNNLDLQNVVLDALRHGRLPLAVLLLHLQHTKGFIQEVEPRDTFDQVREVGRATAYELFCKGESELAVAVLQRLGEDIELCLKQLLSGTVRRSLRTRIVNMMKKLGLFGAHEASVFEKATLIEMLYPSSSFFATFGFKQAERAGVGVGFRMPNDIGIQLTCSHGYKDVSILCGEIDGVVLGKWAKTDGRPLAPTIENEDINGMYWRAAAIWMSSWDNQIVDRIVLDQPSLMGIHVLWESQIDYHLCHGNWKELSDLMEMIPPFLFVDDSLSINCGIEQHMHAHAYRRKSLEVDDLSEGEPDLIYVDIPNVKVFPISTNSCSWLKMLLEVKLAKKLIFTKKYWDGTAGILSILSHSGFIFDLPNFSIYSKKDIPEMEYLSLEVSDQARLAIHKLVLHHCVNHNLPGLLDVYLDHHKMPDDEISISSLLDASGNSHWARWLLLSRMNGFEFDASFANAHSIMHLSSSLSAPELNNMVNTVDGIAEGVGKMAALATLAYDLSPLQHCLYSSTVNIHNGASAQLKLETLRSALQHFPTLWKVLVSNPLRRDFYEIPSFSILNNEYLSWREKLFFSSGGETSLFELLPHWFSTLTRKLIQQFVQGPLGLPSSDSALSYRCMTSFQNASDTYGSRNAVDSVSLEVAIEDNIKNKFYPSSHEIVEIGFEHHLFRGQPLAAFRHILSLRSVKLKSSSSGKELPRSSLQGQSIIPHDLHALLSPMMTAEESILSSVIPLAISHFEDPTLVSACLFLLEICGRSTSSLHVDIAALRRISSFHNSISSTQKREQITLNLNMKMTEGEPKTSLAQTLVDDYFLHQNTEIHANELPSPALMEVLQHLEKASLPVTRDGLTCGSWLLTGEGDGEELRALQKSASQHWALVTQFCQVHRLPISTKYMAWLARDNDWVGFLTEAQVEGCRFELLYQVASKEFTDQRLKSHMLMVLRSMKSMKTKVGSAANFSSTAERFENSVDDVESGISEVELFRILAECEKRKTTGVALLLKAKETQWSLLAMIAACFPDVSPISCLKVWLEIAAARESSLVEAREVLANVAAAVEATNSVLLCSKPVVLDYDRNSPKRRRLSSTYGNDISSSSPFSVCDWEAEKVAQKTEVTSERKENGKGKAMSSDEELLSLSKMVALLCKQHVFLPLLRAFEMFLQSCALLPFIRALQAFSQMRLSEASAHLASFSGRNREDIHQFNITGLKDEKAGTMWLVKTAVMAAEEMLSGCQSPYEKKCLLQLLSSAEYGDGGFTAARFCREQWKIDLTDPTIHQGDGVDLGDQVLGDDALLTALEERGYWDHARTWAQLLKSSGIEWKDAAHHVTEMQAETMVLEWKDFLWDVPDERAALWSHCQKLFLDNSFPTLQAGLFFLKHAKAIEEEVSPRELHEMFLLSLQWLSGSITKSPPVYPLHLLREIETRVWLLAVESEAQFKNHVSSLLHEPIQELPSGNPVSTIEQTAAVIRRMDEHLNAARVRPERGDHRESNQAQVRNNPVVDANASGTQLSPTKSRRTVRSYVTWKQPLLGSGEGSHDVEDNYGHVVSFDSEVLRTSLSEENAELETSVSKWEERIELAELERAVLSLLEFGQITAAKQLHEKLSPKDVPFEFLLVDAAMKIASTSSTADARSLLSALEPEVFRILQSNGISGDTLLAMRLQALELLTQNCTEGRGHGLCKRIIAVFRSADVLGLPFFEAFQKRPIELLQLLSLKAKYSFEQATILVQTHDIHPTSIARVLAESFLKGLLVAHRGGFTDSEKEEALAPLMWQVSDFMKWAELCPSKPEVGHALMRLAITGHEIPHECEVELLILSHHYYKSSACLDGVDVLVALAATKVDDYVAEGDYSCLARLVTGVGNFHALSFIIDILVENGQLELLLQNFSAAADTTGAADTVRGFRMAVLSSLKRFDPHDLNAFSMVYNHFDMKHETASLLESRAVRSQQLWLKQQSKEHNAELLEAMHYFVEEADVLSTVDAGFRTQRTCAQASLVSLQIRMPDFIWLHLSDTNARRAFAEQSRFHEALIVAEAYGLNNSSEWVPVLWSLMVRPDITDQFITDFVAALPLPASILLELARFYRLEVTARGDHAQSHFWAGERVKVPPRSFRSLLNKTRDLRLRAQLATMATGFEDVVNICMKLLDRVPDKAGPLILRKGHGGAYLPLM